MYGRLFLWALSSQIRFFRGDLVLNSTRPHNFFYNSDKQFSLFPVCSEIVKKKNISIKKKNESEFEFNFNSKLAKISSFARFTLIFEKSESDSTQNSNILSELVSLSSPNTGFNQWKKLEQIFFMPFAKNYKNNISNCSLQKNIYQCKK